jgi:hypothetical protein
MTSRSNLNAKPYANVRPARTGISAWFGIGIFLVVVLFSILFFVFASRDLRHRWQNRQPPPGNPPTMPAQGPVIAH